MARRTTRCAGSWRRRPGSRPRAWTWCAARGRGRRSCGSRASTRCQPARGSAQVSRRRAVRASRQPVVGRRRTERSARRPEGPAGGVVSPCFGRPLSESSLRSSRSSRRSSWWARSCCIPAGRTTSCARFSDAGQLVKGNLVQVAGVKVGSVHGIRLTPDGQAEIAMKIDGAEYRPLRRAPRAIIRQASLSGVANRYIDLQLPPGTETATIPPDGVIGQGETTSAVDLDQLFNTFDPTTRRALSGLIRSENAIYAGRGEQAGAGWAYLNPALAASDRLFQEVDRDTPMLQRFIGATSNLVTDVAQRHDELAGLVDHLATTTTALGRQNQALSDGIGRLPDFMRRANTTFVNLRATLDAPAPVVEE